MRATIVRIGATGAGALLALGLLAVPSAGASGSDKAEKDEQSAKVTCFNPEEHSDTQGRSLSDPDGPDNGADKPGCTGGIADNDGNFDRDGNNGCGNDADRQDDNNGNCGGKKAQGPNNDGPEEAGDDDTKVKPEKGDDDTEVKPEEVDADVTVQAADVPAVDASTTTPDPATTVAASGDTAPAGAESTTPETQVLGVTLSAPDTLARTGAGVGGLALLGGLLLGGGRLTVLARRFLRIG